MTRLSIHEIESHYPVHKSNGYSNVRAYWVPISLRETLLNLYREAGIKVRIRYRGSRIHSIGREMLLTSRSTLAKEIYRAGIYRI